MAKLGNHLHAITLAPVQTNQLSVPPDLKEYEALELLLSDYEEQQRELQFARSRTASQLILAEWKDRAPTPAILESLIYTVCFQ